MKVCKSSLKKIIYLNQNNFNSFANVKGVYICMELEELVAGKKNKSPY